MANDKRNCAIMIHSMRTLKDTGQTRSQRTKKALAFIVCLIS